MAKRAKNGMGSIRKRADGTWEGRYSTPDGKQRSVYAKDSKLVAQKLKAAQAAVDAGNWREPTRMTLGEWLDVWLREYRASSAPNTQRNYRYCIDHIKPCCGGILLTKLRPIHIVRLTRELSERYAVGTVRQTLSMLNAALVQAANDGMIAENPNRGIRMPKLVRQRFSYVDIPEYQDFVEAAKGVEYSNEVLFLLATGMRIGELRGLKWDDVDIDKGTLYICRQIAYSGTEFFECAPKAGEVRTIYLPAFAIDILKAQKVVQAEDRLKAGKGWHEDALSAGRVFRRRDGRHHSIASVTHAVNLVGDRLGKHLAPHSLRHSYAIMALRSGIDPKTVQHNLGHASAAMTLDVYASYTDDAGQKAARQIDAVLSPVLGEKP